MTPSAAPSESSGVSWLDDQGIQEVWLPSLVVFELRCGVAALPAGQRRRSLQQGLDQLLEHLVQDRIAPLDGPVDLRDTLISPSPLLP